VQGTRVIITGCRHWEPVDLAIEVLGRLAKKYGPGLVIVHGAASGVDETFSNYASMLSISQERHPALWGKYGNRAGPTRNQEMVDLGAVLCVAVHRDIHNSKGTRDCARRAIAAGIPTCLMDGTSPDPVWLKEV
jgi:hypothetical protein